MSSQAAQTAPQPTTRSEATRSPDTANRPDPARAAKAPVGPGVISVVGLVLAALVVALGVVGIHDALVAAGVVSGSDWIGAAVDAIDGATPPTWLVPLGAVLILLGLWLLITALRPRPRKAMALAADTGVFLRPRDAARLARDAAEDVDGVISAKADATVRKISVGVHATTSDGVEQQVADAVTDRLSALAKTPRIKVTVKTQKD